MEILLNAVVTKVDPYCSEVHAANGRVLKVVQRLFDGNTPQLNSQYIIGIPWSRRDLKRHWASSVHKRVKIRCSALPLSSMNARSNSTSTLSWRLHESPAVERIDHKDPIVWTSPSSLHTSNGSVQGVSDPANERFQACRYPAVKSMENVWSSKNLDTYESSDDSDPIKSDSGEPSPSSIGPRRFDDIGFSSFSAPSLPA